MKLEYKNKESIDKILNDRKAKFNKPFTVINLVIKGKWIYSGLKFLKNEGLEDVIKNRERQPITDHLYIKLFLLRVEIFFLEVPFNFMVYKARSIGESSADK